MDIENNASGVEGAEISRLTQLSEELEDANLRYQDAKDNKERNRIKKEINRINKELQKAREEEGGQTSKSETAIAQTAEKETIEIKKIGAKVGPKFWTGGDRAEWQKESIEESRKAVKMARELREEEAKKNIVRAAEPVIAFEATASFSAEMRKLEEKKASLSEYLNTLKSAFENSKKRDSNFSKGLDRDVSLDDPEEIKTRTNIGIKMTNTREELSRIDKDIATLGGKSSGSVDIQKISDKKSYNPKSYSAYWNERSADLADLRAQKRAKKAIKEKFAMNVAQNDQPAIDMFEEEKARDIDYTGDIPNTEALVGFYADKNKKDAQIINPNQLKQKNMPKKTIEEAYKGQLGDKDESNLYEDVNKKYALEEEQEKAKEAYGTEFGAREKESTKEKAGWEKLREKENIEKEKRAGKLKEQEEFAESYKRQFGEEDAEGGKKPVTPDVVDNVAGETMSELAKQLKEKKEKFDKLPKEAQEMIRDEMMESEIKRMGDQYTVDELKEKETVQAKEIADLKETVERAKEVEARLAEMQAELDRQYEETKNPTLKKAINFFKKPKVYGAIMFGLAGVGVYAASGGTAVPVYFAVKAALAKAGISIFVPAAAGQGLSTWGTAAAAGGFSGYLAEKLGLSHEKSDKEKHQEGLEKLKNIGKEQSAEIKVENWRDSSGKIDIGAVVKFVGEKDQELITRLENDPELLSDMVKAFKKKLSIFQFSDKQKNINTTYFWLENKQREIKKAQMQAPKEQTVNESAPSSSDQKRKQENEKRFEALKGIYEIADLIRKNDSKINTNVLLVFHGEVEKSINTHKYEVVGPLVNLAKYIVENKEKVSFLKKTDKIGVVYNASEKEDLVREIKANVLRMSNEGQLGATNAEKEKNRKIITDLVDSIEFKSKI